MARSWRLARSLQRLESEITSRWPGTTVWDIGDENHQNSWSDHNPSVRGDVVCALDILDDGGMDLDWFAEHIRTCGHPDLDYVIYRDRIASAGGRWRSYGGDYHSHVHVSVGDGPDGRATGGYDSTDPWGITGGHGTLPATGERADVIGLSKGDSGEAVKGLQATLRYAGHDPGEVDGDYGPKTASAVLRMRRSQGSGVDDGDNFTGWAYAQLMRAMAKEYGGKTERGPAGPAGKDGKDGRDGKDGADGVLELPVDVEISGRITKAGS